MSIKKKIYYYRNIWHINLINRLSANNLMMKNMFSYVQNKALIEQKADFDKWEQYQRAKKIHDILGLYDIEKENLQRIGKHNDGGYIMNVPLSRRKIAYSIGISDDVSWDRDVAKHGYDIFQYDHTISALPENNKAFHWKRIGIVGGEKECSNLKTLTSMLIDNKHEDLDGLLLKMDIEGSEWEVFSSVDIQNLEQFDQIVVELHNIFDESRHDLVMEALEKLSSIFIAIHIHANNYSDIYYCGDLVTPNTIEVTFVNKKIYKYKKSDKILPIMLDQENCVDIPDVVLGRWNV